MASDNSDSAATNPVVVAAQNNDSDEEYEYKPLDLKPAIDALGCKYTMPVENKDVYIVHGFAERFGIDAREAQKRLHNDYPHRKEGDKIAWAEPQWIHGDHRSLRYRGNVLTRNKMWFQNGEPAEHGFRKYLYTGWQWRVLPATSAVERVPWLAKFTGDVNDWLWKHCFVTTNHYIVTAYDKEDCGIGMHSDKAKSISELAPIIVVKTGECGRPFRITDSATDKELFNEVVAPGDAVIMTMQANLATKHGVPILNEPTDTSGSIVMRKIIEEVPWEKLKAVLRKRERDEEE